MAEYADYHHMPPVRRAPLIGLIGHRIDAQGRYAGTSRAGKDTVAARLVDVHNYVRVAFADPLKQAALKIDPIVVCGEGPDDPFEPTLRLSDAVRIYGWEVAKDNIPEVRRFLKYLGDGIRQAVGERVWLDKALAEADTLEAAGYPVVVTDVRYANEARAITARGGVLVRVVRPGGSVASVDHASESELDAWPADLEIVNDAGLEALREQADRVAYTVGEDRDLR